MFNSLICHSFLLQVFSLTGEAGDEDQVAKVDQGLVF